MPIVIGRGCAEVRHRTVCEVVCPRTVRKNCSQLLNHLEYVTKWIKSCLLSSFGTFKMPILMFISILVLRHEGQIWNPVRRDTRIYVRRILNASRISKTQLNSSTINPS